MRRAGFEGYSVASATPPWEMRATARDGYYSYLNTLEDMLRSLIAILQALGPVILKG